jgi:hypothetical protein
MDARGVTLAGLAARWAAAPHERLRGNTADRGSAGPINSTREQFLTLRWALVETGRVQAVRLAARADGEWWDAPVALEGVVGGDRRPGRHLP